MKRLLLGVLVACFAFLSTNAQDKKGPQIEFSKNVHNYGTIENGADGTCEFKFKNTGKEDLQITNCRASCGCTIPAWPKEAIKPGKSGVIKVKYDTKRTGMINKTITITSNATNAPSKVVSIKGTIKAPKAVAAPATNKPQVATPTATNPVPNKTAVKAKAVNANKVVTAKKAATATEATAKTKRWYQFWKKK